MSGEGSSLSATQSGRLEVVVPEETLMAGQDNAVSFILRNPFAIPVTVTKVSGPSTQSVTTVSRNGAESRNTRGVDVLVDILPKVLATISVPFAGIQIETARRMDRVVNVQAEPKSSVNFDEDLGPYTELNITAEEGAHIEIGRKVTEAAPEAVVIPPGGDRIFTIFVKTTHWLLFTPQRFPVNVQLEYDVGGDQRAQVIAASFSINPPLMSILCGSVIGGTLGAVARALQSPAELGAITLVQAAASVVMSIIASITLSRKTGAQSFITVEDFFGAFAIGALIGYGGSEYFRRAVFSGATASAPDT